MVQVQVLVVFLDEWTLSGDACRTKVQDTLGEDTELF